MNTRFCSPGRLLPYLFYFSLLYFLLWCWKPTLAQGDASYKPLQIGDKVPDVIIKNILHYKTPTARFADFKGKLVILDFWATWCSPCVAMIPKIDSLQKQFADKVQFLPVTYQSKKEVITFNTKYAARRTKRIAIPEVVEDGAFHALFPHTFLPHYVWIGADGLVKAVTGMQEINATAINTYLNNSDAKLEQKIDKPRIAYDGKKPFLLNGNGGDGSNLIYHSVLTAYTEGLSSGYHIAQESLPPYNTSKIAIRNSPISRMYSIAYGAGQIYLGKNRIVYETADTLLLKRLGGKSKEDLSNWNKENTFCYEIVVPKRLQKDIYQIMQQQVDKLIPEYSAALENRRTRYYALERTTENDLLKSAGGQKVNKVDALGATIKNEPLGKLYGWLNVIHLQHLPVPFINATGYTGNVDMEFTANMSDINSLNQQLEKYGLRISEREGEVPMLIIRNRTL